MKRLALITLLGALALFLAACAAGVHSPGEALSGNPIYQLTLGFWHGLLAPFIFLFGIVARLYPAFDHVPITLYLGINAGVPYNTGFFSGLVFWPIIAWSIIRP